MGASAAMELAKALEYNNITTSIELDENNIKPEGIEAINIFLNRNREYLSSSLENLFAGRDLNITQYNTIKSHYAMLKENSLSYIPTEMKERISQDPEHLMERLRSFESKIGNVTSEIDAKADILLRSLKEDRTITNVSNTGLEENNISSNKVDAINNALNNNRIFLRDSLEAFFSRKELSSDQKETIKAHDTQIMNGSLSFIPKDVRDKIARKYHQIKSQSKDSESRKNEEPEIKHLIAKAASIEQQRRQEGPRAPWAEGKKWQQSSSFAEAVKKEKNKSIRGTNLQKS
jgi:hypothetical protein